MLVTEILACIRAPHFTAGIVLWDGRVIEAAPIVGYMKKQKWSRDRVRSYCKDKGWEISVIHETRRHTTLDGLDALPSARARPS